MSLLGKCLDAAVAALAGPQGHQSSLFMGLDLQPVRHPKVTWLTLSGRRVEFHEGTKAPSWRGRCGLIFRVLVHHDLVEDRIIPRDNK